MNTQTAPLPLEGATIIIQDDDLTAFKLAIEFRDAGAVVIAPRGTRQTIDLMWAMRPLAVVMNPERDLVGAAFISAVAAKAEVEFIQFANDGVGHDGGIRVARSSGVSAVVEAVIAAAWGDGTGKAITGAALMRG